MRVLVTGGTGFIGRLLVETVRARGDEVVVVSRSGGRGTVPWDSVGAEVERADAIVHLAGEPVAEGRWTPERMERIRASRVDTTRALAEAMARAPHKPSVFVSGSAVGIYGPQGPSARPTDEDGEVADDFLARVASAWESAADPARSVGVRVVHPRIGVVLGRGGGAFEKLRIPYQLGVGGPVGRGDQWISWIHVRDVVAALLFLIERAALSGPVNVVAPNAVTMDAFSAALARAMHRPALFRVPGFALKLLLGEGPASVVLEGQRVLPRRLEDEGFAFAFPRIDEAFSDLCA